MKEQEMLDMNVERQEAEVRASARMGFKSDAERDRHARAFAQRYANGNAEIEKRRLAIYTQTSSLYRNIHEDTVSRLYDKKNFERLAAASMEANAKTDQEKARQAALDDANAERDFRRDAAAREAREIDDRLRADRDREDRQRAEDRTREDRAREDRDRESQRREEGNKVRAREERDGPGPLKMKGWDEYAVRKDEQWDHIGRAEKASPQEAVAKGVSRDGFTAILNPISSSIEYWKRGELAVVERQGEIINTQREPTLDAIALQARLAKERGVKEIHVQGTDRSKEAQTLALAREGVRVSNPDMKPLWERANEAFRAREDWGKNPRGHERYDTLNQARAEIQGLERVVDRRFRDPAERMQDLEHRKAIADARVAMMKARGWMDFNGRPVTPAWAAMSPESRERMRNEHLGSAKDRYPTVGLEPERTVASPEREPRTLGELAAAQARKNERREPEKAPERQPEKAQAREQERSEEREQAQAQERSGDENLAAHAAMERISPADQMPDGGREGADELSRLRGEMEVGREREQEQGREQEGSESRGSEGPGEQAGREREGREREMA